VIDSYEANDGPMYMRFGRPATPIVYDEIPESLGDGVDVMREGKDVSLIATGHMVWRALEAAETLEREDGIEAEVVNVSIVKPLASEPVLESISKTGVAVTAEEHRVAGGLADAVRTVAASDAPWAAIGTRLAASLYGARVLRDGIEDDPDNATRFVWLAHAGAPPPASTASARDWKTSIVFAGAGDASPGWLVRCLSEFAFRGVNLTKIESRPRRRQLGHYLFLADLQGRADERPVADAIAGLHAHCEEVRVLGTYPAA
jgi:hypothetical protein